MKNNGHEIRIENENIIIDNLNDFILSQVLECGQCFRFDKIGEEEYIIIAKDRSVHIKQENNCLIFFQTSIEDYKNIWNRYFDIDRDYEKIKRDLLKRDPLLKTAIQSKNGIRILNQDFFEMLITFIISQNKQIPHIKQIVKNISERYGDEIIDGQGNKVYMFPKVDALVKVSEDELRECKVGFRAPYIVDACNRVYNGRVTEDILQSLDIDQARELLMTIKGVGEKVANCVLLFGLGRREVFPVDVWMKRIMEDLYLKEETPNKKIEEYAYNKYGELGGYAQQYLFMYGREKGKKQDL